MDELNEQLTAATTRLAAAAEALENAISRFDAQHQELNAKVDRIVAAIDDSIAVRIDDAPGEPATEAGELKSRVAELERANQELKAQAARAARKTLPPLVSALLSKETAGDSLDSAALDKALNSLSLEQRIAVKAEMARAGLLE
jgi:Skp family chaperone for outer membrane proteins